MCEYLWLWLVSLFKFGWTYMQHIGRKLMSPSAFTTGKKVTEKQTMAVLH